MSIIHTIHCRVCAELFRSVWEEAELCPTCEADQDAMADFNDDDEPEQSSR